MKQAYNYNDFWIIFMPSEGWYVPFEKKNFNHCVLITRDKFNWIEIHPANEVLNISILGYRPEDDVIARYQEKFRRIKKNVRVLYVGFKPEREPSKCYMLPSCIGVVLHAMGLRLFCITPYSLFKKLFKMSEKDKKRFGINRIMCL